MIVSALLTSVGINLGLCVLLFALYSVLRKQPGNIEVYVPRLVVEGKAQRTREFNLEDLLPNPGWLRKAWQTSEDELLSSCGLDAVVFIRIFIFSFKVFSVAAGLGMFILLPINYFGDQLRETDFTDLQNKSLDLFNISNVKDGSNWLWAHFSAAYVITGVVCYLLYSEYKYISLKRLEQFYASKPLPQQYTVVVTGIPSHSGCSLSDTIESFFMEYHPSTYLSHVVVHRTNKLRGLIRDAENIYKRLTRLRSRPHNPASSERNCFFGLFGKSEDLVQDYSKRLEDLEENVRQQQSGYSKTVEEVSAAFVCFKSRYGASTALRIQLSENPIEWVTEQAPEPHDVYWPLFSSSFIRRWISKLLVIVASITLTILFLLPVAFVQGLTNLNQLKTLLPFLNNILEISVVSQVITGYLPSLILQIFFSIVPPIMKIFSTMQGNISLSGIEKSACSKVLWFTIWNGFFAIVLTGSVTSQVQIFLEPKDIPWKLAVYVPTQASFYIAYVVTSWTSLSKELTRVIALLGDWIGGCSGCFDNELQAPSMTYHSEIPRILLFLLIGLIYFLLSPLILPFILIFFCIGYIIYRNQLLNVYLPKYETGGQFWPIVHNSTIFSLVLMQAMAFGIFSLKKLPLASSLLLPLPVVTLLFHGYCRKRFEPVFQTFSAETLIKKDRSEQNDPGMNEFFDKLKTAYNDPSLAPKDRSQYADDQNTPLLFSLES
ncbi:CSC1-like protein HYP1 [Dendrobium catenatum]|uniref:DNA-directed RNA polymerase III subunit RPC2 n=1 Tax=Dendrobium catenatum TaxID=906689 RepID=A0A2I0W921_9ASPA|nr:CSC1-like protein HYP1 [Dendrobium catenatum]PKU72157.1 DNA-directed RNA polymerase III subunit RPC2 [Dendrobium catenatum]